MTKGAITVFGMVWRILVWQHNLPVWFSSILVYIPPTPHFVGSFSRTENEEIIGLIGQAGRGREEGEWMDQSLLSQPPQWPLT